MNDDGALTDLVAALCFVVAFFAVARFFAYVRAAAKESGDR